jgi:hypothetical protein
MNFLHTAIVLAAAALSAPAADISGTWKVDFVGPEGDRPKTVAEMVFELETEGNQLTGIAHIGSWPGDAEIEDGKIDGDRFSFTAVGKLPWSSKSRDGEASGYPRLRFTGTIDEGKMKLTLVWDSVMIYGRAGSVREYEMRGRKTR